MTNVKITPTDNGPYQVNGPVTVTDAAGTAYDISDQTTIYLCRCGNSEHETVLRRNPRNTALPGRQPSRRRARRHLALRCFGEPALRPCQSDLLP